MNIRIANMHIESTTHTLQLNFSYFPSILNLNFIQGAFCVLYNNGREKRRRNTPKKKKNCKNKSCTLHKYLR